MELCFSALQNGSQVLAVRTGMTPRSFAQSRLPHSLNEKGYIITGEYSVLDWKFEGTFSQANGGKEEICLYGPSYAGKSLLANIETLPPHEAWAISHAAITAIGKAGLRSHAASCGPGGILCGADGSFLLLPAEMYARCTANGGNREELAERLQWVHPDWRTLGEDRAFAFTAGVISYRIISGIPPFQADGTTEALSEQIAAAIRSGRFTKLEKTVWQLREKPARYLDSLIDTSLAVSLDTYLAFGGNYSAIIDSEREGVEPSAEFLQIKAQEEKRVNDKRKAAVFKKKHRTLFVTLAGVAIALAFLAGMVIDGLSSKPTTKGMSADEVIEGFYAAVGTLDQEIPRAYLGNKIKNEYTEFTATLFVTSRMRETYEQDARLVTPDVLLIEEFTQAMTVYGMTRLEISKVEETDKSAVYDVSFYLFMPYSPGNADANMLDMLNPPVQLSVYRYRDRTSLSLIKDRWLITDITQTERTLIEGDGKRVLELLNTDADNLPWAPER